MSYQRFPGVYHVWTPSTLLSVMASVGCGDTPVGPRAGAGAGAGAGSSLQRSGPGLDLDLDLDLGVDAEPLTFAARIAGDWAVLKTATGAWKSPSAAFEPGNPFVGPECVPPRAETSFGKPAFFPVLGNVFRLRRELMLAGVSPEVTAGVKQVSGQHLLTKRAFALLPRETVPREPLD